MRYDCCMRRALPKSALTIEDLVLRSTEAARRDCGKLRLSKQGVYAISNDGRVETFQRYPLGTNAENAKRALSHITTRFLATVPVVCGHFGSLT